MTTIPSSGYRAGLEAYRKTGIARDAVDAAAPHIARAAKVEALEAAIDWLEQEDSGDPEESVGLAIARARLGLELHELDPRRRA